MRVGVLECDHVDERFRGIAGGYPQMFASLLEPHIPELSIELYDACHGRLPATVGECHGYICTGSRVSVYESPPWIHALMRFMRSLRVTGRPFVGICFGHQLLAAAFGGEVAKAEQGWGVGALDMNIVQKRPWMQPPLQTCRLQYMHQDQVHKLPEGATLLARGDHCEVAMFVVDETMLGIEGHPEFPVAYNEALIRDRTERIGRARADAGLASFTRSTDERIVGAWMAKFLRR